MARSKVVKTSASASEVVKAYSSEVFRSLSPEVSMLGLLSFQG